MPASLRAFFLLRIPTCTDYLSTCPFVVAACRTGSPKGKEAGGIRARSPIGGPGRAGANPLPGSRPRQRSRPGRHPAPLRRLPAGPRHGCLRPSHSGRRTIAGARSAQTRRQPVHSNGATAGRLAERLPSFDAVGAAAVPDGRIAGAGAGRRRISNLVRRAAGGAVCGIGTPAAGQSGARKLPSSQSLETRFAGPPRDGPVQRRVRCGGDGQRACRAKPAGGPQVRGFAAGRRGRQAWRPAPLRRIHRRRAHAAGVADLVLFAQRPTVRRGGAPAQGRLPLGRIPGGGGDGANRTSGGPVHPPPSPPGAPTASGF